MKITINDPLGSAFSSAATPLPSLNTGSLLYLDFTMSDCWDGVPLSPITNLALEESKGLLGNDEGFAGSWLWRGGAAGGAGADNGIWAQAPDGGMEAAAALTPPGVALRYTPTADVVNWMRADGTRANQPDLLFSLWFRRLKADSTGDAYSSCFRWGNANPSLGSLMRLEHRIANSSMHVIYGSNQGSVDTDEAQNDMLHVVQSRYGVWVDGVKISSNGFGDNPYSNTADYGAVVFAEINNKNYPLYRFYRAHIEDLKTSNRTEDAFIAEERNYVLNYTNWGAAAYQPLS